MPYVKKIELISQTVNYGTRHQPIITDNTPTRAVFAEITSAQQSEFFQASAVGMAAEGKALVWAFEYHGETIMQFDGNRYAIYRTYIVPGSKKIELHFGQQVGPNTVPGVTP